MACVPSIFAANNDKASDAKYVWIKGGTTVYKEKSENSESTQISLPHYVKVEKEDGEWMEFSWYEWDFFVPTELKGYKYVKVENTSVEKPDEEPTPDVPDEPDIPEDPVDVETTVGETSITTTGLIPSGVELKAEVENTYHSNISDLVDDSDIEFAFDITLENSDGSEWQPENGEKVLVSLDAASLGIEDGEKVGIIHEHDGYLVKLGEYYVSEGKLVFETEGFSTFYGYVVDFEYNGHKFSLGGGGTSYLYDIFAGIGIDKTEADVENISFSDSSLLKVEHKDGAWVLTSLKSFSTEEWLTITFKDGTIIEIRVTDPIVYNYAVGSDITNVPLLDTENITIGTATNGDIANTTGYKGKANKEIITMEMLAAAGTTDKTVATTHMIIYAEEGMALRFGAGTHWQSDGSRPMKNDDEIWFWGWDGTYNYAIVEEGTAGKQASFVLYDSSSITAETTSICNVTLVVVERSNPVKLEEVLSELNSAEGIEDTYSIKNVPVTLYNYDGKAWNEYYEKQNATDNFFAFSGDVKGVTSKDTDVVSPGWASSGVQANGGGGVALMGIVKDTLDGNGLPVMSQGQKVDLFSTSATKTLTKVEGTDNVYSDENGRTVYEDVDFQFVYNEDTGYYTYNAAFNHAQLSSDNKTLELYKQSLAPSDTPFGASHGNGGFYPFEDINKAFTNAGYTKLSWSEWATKLEKEAYELTPSQYSTDISLTNATNPASTTELHYGIQVASDFYMPKGKQLDGHDMIYEFTGDDDLWVFIDGKLVLDIGGGHTYVSGRFNLTTGDVWVEKYTKLAAADGGSYQTRVQGTDLKYTDSFITSLKDDQMHTIQIFYLERHAGVSNCRMRFNLPLVPSNSVNVSKNLENQNREQLSVNPDVDYMFQIFTAKDDDDNVDATNFVALANTEFTILENGVEKGTDKTSADGKFTLKEGQRASFAGIDRFTEVYVVEFDPKDGYIYEKTQVSVNNADAVDYTFGNMTDTKIMQLNASINFDFVNIMETAPLTISKNVVGGTNGLTPDHTGGFGFT
ncbi:MAG: hypothetical protein E7218_08260, partial [Anaerofustis stercorihominis]|nr:hypothetical protein [Anaerofustis stercorihominis]